MTSQTHGKGGFVQDGDQLCSISAEGRMSRKEAQLQEEGVSGRRGQRGQGLPRRVRPPALEAARQRGRRGQAWRFCHLSAG